MSSRAEPTVSVVLTFFEGREFLRAALESLDRQTWKGFDAVLVDDGSREDLRDEGFARPWLRVVRQPNAGAPAAKNAGVRAARGDFVTFLDYDDLMHPRRLEVFRDAVTAHPGAAVFVGGVRNFRTTKTETRLEPVVAGVCGGGVLVRRDAFAPDAVGAFDETLKLNYFMDWWMRRDRARLEVVECLDAVCYRRLHDRNASLVGARELEKGATQVIFNALKRRRDGG